MQEIRYAFRSLLKTPGFTLVAILTLAVGIGGTTAIFSVVNGVLLEALPYPDAGRIVTIWEANERTRTMAVSNPNFDDWRTQARSFSAIAAWSGSRTTVLGGTEPVAVGAYGVSRGFFDVMGVPPAVGRTFAPEETALNGPPVAVLGHGLWQRIFGGDPDLGSLSVNVNGVTAQVIGVMPPGFEFPASAEVWYCRDTSVDGSGRTGHNLRVAARLADGVDLAVAQAEMSAIAGRLEAEHGDDHDGTDASVIPLHERMVGSSRATLWLLFGAVTLVLLTACVNVANTLVARGADRRRELAIRLALGADRRRVVRLLLTENLLLGLAGGVGGLVLAGWIVRAIVALGPSVLPRVEAVSIDTRVMLFTLVLSLLTPVVFGLLPSVQVSRTELRDALTEGGRAVTTGRARLRATLVAVEMALALVLLVGSGLLVRSFVKVLSVDPGFDPSSVVTLLTAVPGQKYSSATQAADFYAELLARLRTLPGVRSAGLINAPPLGGMDANGAFLFEGQSIEDLGGNWTAQSASYRVASDDYFRAMGIPVVRGRAFAATDDAGHEAVALVNLAMARKYWPDGDPIGQRIQFAGMDRENPLLTIVGVAGDVRHRDLTGDAVPEVYVNYRQLPMRTIYFVTTVARLEPGLAVGGFVNAARASLRGVDPDVPVEFSTMEAQVMSSVASRRFLMFVIAGFGTVSLLLAAIGIYGVLAYSVSQRTPEIGVRMALGADARSVVRLVLGSALGWVGAGVAGGLVAAVLFTRVLQSFLFDVEPTDPVTLAGALAFLTAVALLAGYIPARRATRVDPIVAMRVE